jgi:hypothetical protein
MPPSWYAHHQIRVSLPPACREKLLRHEAFTILKAEGKINDVVIENMALVLTSAMAYS